MLQFQTVSSPDVALHVLLPDEFKKLDAHLRASFPLVWEKLIVEKVGRIWGKRGCLRHTSPGGRGGTIVGDTSGDTAMAPYLSRLMTPTDAVVVAMQTGEGQLSYLITWNGSESSLPPALFISHIDVVPIDPSTLGQWEHGPFSGDIADGFVWGRGAMDVKVSPAHSTQREFPLIPPDLMHTFPQWVHSSLSIFTTQIFPIVPPRCRLVWPGCLRRPAAYWPRALSRSAPLCSPSGRTRRSAGTKGQVGGRGGRQRFGASIKGAGGREGSDAQHWHLSRPPPHYL